MANLENSPVLKEIGLNEKNQWILHEEKAQKFFEFIANNLDSSNILTNLELKEYEDLKEARKVLDEAELEQELKNIEQEFPGFFSVTDDVLDELENQVKELDCEIAEKTDRISRMRDYENDQLKTLAEIERQNNEIELKQRLFTEECMKKSKELFKLQESNSQEILEINKIYTQQQNMPSLMCQMPLDLYFNKCNQLLGLLQTYMNHYFNIKTSKDLFSDDEEAQLCNIYQIKSEIIDLEKRKFEEKLNISGINHVIENIDEHKNMIRGDYYEVRSVIENLIMEKENLETQLNVLMLEAQMLIENEAEQKIKDVFHEFYKGKHSRASERAEKVNKIYDLTDNIVHACELLWVAMQLDLDKLKNRVDNSEEMNNQSLESTKRIRQIKQISKEDRSEFYSHQFLSSFQKLLIDNLHCSKDELSTVEKCFKQFINHDEQVNTILKMLVEQKHLTRIQNSMKQIDEQSNILKDLIFCGPTNKPRLYDPKFITPLYNKQQKKKEFEKLFHELKINFQNKVIEPYTNDKFYRMKELLYIWFCSEPKKVILAIKEVQTKAAQEGSASYKALNITLS